MKKYNWTRVLALSLFLTGLMFFFYMTRNPFLQFVELKALDVRFFSRGQEPAGSFVALATVDEKSLDEIGKWPWPRAKIAALIERLSDEGASVIAMDIFFSEPDENNNLRFIEKLLNEAREAADNDSILAAAIRRSKSPVVLGYSFHFSKEEIAHLSEDELAQKSGNIRPSAVKLVQFTSPQAQQVKVREALLWEGTLDSPGYTLPGPFLSGLVFTGRALLYG
jgi:adenylate cyclase